MRDFGTRCVAAVSIVALMACGKQEPQAGGSGAAPVPTAGGGSGDVSIALPAGTDVKATAVAKPKGELPASVAPYKQMLDEKFHTLKVVELGPDGTKLPAAGAVTVTIDPKDLPAGATLANVIAVSVSADGTLEDVPLTVVGGNQVKAEVKHFSILMFLMPLVLVGIVGGGAMYLKGASESIMRPNCGTWLTPDAPGVAALAKGMTIDKDSGEIHIDANLKGKDVDQGAHMLKPDQVLAAGVGDCVNMSVVVGSALIAKGYPVRLVSGGAYYRSHGKDVQGGHEWVETVVDGKPYYVDTFDAPAMKLVPLHEASVDHKLTRGAMCGKDTGPQKYDAHWYDAHEAPPGDDVGKLQNELEDLLTQHKALNARCISGSDNNACMERKKVYDRAKAIQDKLAALKK